MIATVASPAVARAAGPCRVPEDHGRKLASSAEALVYRTRYRSPYGQRVLACWRQTGRRTLLGYRRQTGTRNSIYSDVHGFEIAGRKLAFFFYWTGTTGWDLGQSQFVVLDMASGKLQYCVDLGRNDQGRTVVLARDGVAAWTSLATGLRLFDARGLRELRGEGTHVSGLRLGADRLTWEERGRRTGLLLERGVMPKTVCEPRRDAPRPPDR